MGTIEKPFYQRVAFVFILDWLVNCGGSLRATPRRSRCVGSSFLISSSPSVFSVVYLNRVNRDFALFRELGFSEFQTEFHAGLVELTVQITHQRIDQSAARALSHILPTPIDALCLTPMVFVPLSVRWITCGQSAFTMSHVFFACDGLSTDRICFQVSNSSECVRTPSLTLSNLMHLHLNYILCHSCVMFNRQRMYSPLYQRPSKATFTSWNTVGLFSISLLLRVAAASKSLSNAQIQGLFLLPSRIGMYKSTYPPSLNYTVPRRVSVLKGALKAPVPPLPGECRTPETRPRTSRRMRATPSRKALRTQAPESPTECSSLAKE